MNSMLSFARLFHELIAEGMHDRLKVVVRVAGIVILLASLRL